MRLTSDDGDFVELEPRGRPDEADLRLDVRVSRGGFAGQVSTWIERHAWFQFTQELAALEQRRAGQACVSSMSPDEFELIVKSTDRLGHLGVEGFISKCEYDRKVSLRFSVFGFDPSQLAPFARQARAASEDLGANSGASSKARSTVLSARTREIGQTLPE